MFFDRLLNIGVSRSTPAGEVRYIRNTNLIALMIGISDLVIAGFLYSRFGAYSATVTIFVLAWFFLSIVFLSYKKWHTASRIVLSFLVPLFTFYVSVILREQNPEVVTEYTFFNVRVILLGTVVIPIVVFPARQKLLLISGMLIPGLLIWFFDPISNMLGIGYEQMLGPPKIGYDITNLYFLVTYTFVVVALLIFKFNNETLVEKNMSLVKRLRESNKELMEAGNTIRQQAVTLKQQNEELQKIVEQRTSELKRTNEELIKHNSELRQFSNTLSHNLRSPVANLLGLTQLFELEKDEEGRKQLIDHIKSAAQAMDMILKDLGKVMDIRNHLFQIKENVSLSEEFDRVRTMLQDQIAHCKAQITTDFTYDNAYCIRSYLNSIFFNLLSNSLKYRNPNEPCRIKVSSVEKGDKVFISIQDNGVGIDLKRFGDKLFGMYKRFHDHTDGKGLGLFLVKQQVEALGGRIEVESEVGKGTTFRLIFPKSVKEEITEQVYYDSDVATIWFDAVDCISTLVWKRKPTSDEYKEVLQRNLDIFRSYKCYGCLADVRNLGWVPQTDREWFVRNILSEAEELGVQKIIILHDEDDGKDDQYFAMMQEELAKHGVQFAHTHHSLEEARKIIRGIPVR